MATPLLTTKFHIPQPRPELILRPRLIEQVNAGVRNKLTLVSAPAGFGKSTLLSTWVQQPESHERVAWLSLDEGDNDLTRFLTYFVAALQSIESSVGQGVLGALQSPGEVNVDAVLTTLLNEIAEFPDDVILILDDYHVIEDQSIDQALTFLLGHLPAQIHLVVASRIDPSWSLSRLRASAQMTEIRANDLRFSPDEAAAFLNQVSGFDLSAQDVTALGARTEGWIAGLQLAALSMQGSDDVQAFVHSFTGSNRYILEYLGEEVLQQRPQGTRDFLLQTSILSRLSAPLCDTITDRNDSQAILESLEAANLFIVPLDNERHWYRYHHLFADLLRQRLHQTQQKLVPILHSQASEWYRLHGFQFEAVNHALAGGAFEMAADLIEANGLSLIGQGAFTIVRNWIDTLPGSIVRKRPYLCVYHAWTSNFTYQLDAIEPYLQDAQRALQAQALPADNAVVRDLHGHIATLRAWDARRKRDNSLAIDLLEDAVDCLGDSNSFVRTFADLNLGLAYMDDGKLVKAVTSFRDAVLQGRVSENELASLTATSHLAAVLILQGRLREAANLCRRTIRDQLERHEKPPPTMCMVYLRLGWILAEWNDVHGFFAHVSQGVVLADQIGFDSVVTAGARSMAWEKQVLAKQGTVIEFSEDVAEIIDRVAAVETNASGMSHSSEEDTNHSAIQAENVEIYLTDDAYFEIWPGYSDHARAVRLAEEGRSEEALDLLARIYESARAEEGAGLMIEARSAQALIYQSKGDVDHALDALKDALSLGEPEGYIRTFVDRDAPMAQLLYEAAARGFMPDYTSKLLAAFWPHEQGDTTPPAQPLIEPLSPREIEVLQLIAQGLSNREICERLFLALSTVKGHNQNIYGKLQVQRRTEAVARARALGLV